MARKPSRGSNDIEQPGKKPAFAGNAKTRTLEYFRSTTRPPKTLRNHNEEWRSSEKTLPRNPGFGRGVRKGNIEEENQIDVEQAESGASITTKGGGRVNRSWLKSGGVGGGVVVTIGATREKWE
jgi:hypothetical protein